MHILLQKHITLTECGAAEEMLCDFYSLLPELYGETSCIINAHTLTHLAYYVGHAGPIQPFLLNHIMGQSKELLTLHVK